VTLVGKHNPEPLKTRAQFQTDFAALSKSVIRLWPPKSFPNPSVMGKGGTWKMYTETGHTRFPTMH
jgi:hypothetical protein